MPTDDLFAPITSTPELLDATGDRAWLQAMLDAEAALARAEASAGVIPAEAAEAIGRCARVDLFDPAELGRAARGGGNPVIPLVQALTAAVDPAARDWVHWGATSQDILDSAAMLVAHRGASIIDTDLRQLAAGCAALADAHRRTVMVGRTLLQPALPITFGLKAAEWLDAVTDGRIELAAADAGLAAQLGGAAGTLAALGDAGVPVAARFATEIGLAEPNLPWHTARQRVVRFAGALGTLAGTAAKISGDVGLLMQAEVAEAFEPAAPGRGGSSTLPHKRNPVGAAAVGAAFRRVVALMTVFYGALAGEHERSVEAWPAECQSLGDLVALAGGAVARTAETVCGLDVDPVAMSARVAHVGDSLLAERVSLALAPRLGRAGAQSAVSAAGRQGGSFTSALLADPAVAAVISAAEVEELLEPAGYLGSTDAWIDRALARHREHAGGW